MNYFFIFITLTMIARVSGKIVLFAPEYFLPDVHPIKSH